MGGTTGRFAILEQFLADGVEYIFGNPGTVEQGFLDALSDYPQLRYILTLQETVAVMAADGYARAGRKPAVVQLHSGVGLGNGIGALYQAMRGHAPLVVIAGEAGVRYDAMDAQMAADLVGMAKPVTKWAGRVLHPDSLLRMLRRAIKIAATPPMGPVFLALPMDVLDAPCTEEVVPTVIPETRVAPVPELVARAASLLAGARAPLIIVGDGVAQSGAVTELTRVAELLGAQVWAADAGEVNISGVHPQYCGQLGHMFGEVSRAICSRADAVLICGTYVFPEVFPMLDSVFRPGAKVVHVDLNPYEIAKNFCVDLGLVSDPKATLAALAATLNMLMTDEEKQAAKSRASALAAAKEHKLASERNADAAMRNALPMHAGSFMEELANQLPPAAVVFDEALTTSPELTRYLSVSEVGRYFLTRGGSLGVGFPGAIGVKLAHLDKTVIGFSGDGGAMYTIQALWTAAHYHIDAKFVVCNNRSYRLLKQNLQQYWNEREFTGRRYPASFDIRAPNIDFVAMAQGMGVPGARVETRDQIGPSIRRALKHQGPFLIDLILADP